MTKKTMIRFLPILLLGFFTQACGSIQIGVATPITENEPVPLTAMQEPTPNAIVPVENESQPTEEPTEDFSHLWVEYWDAKYGYGIALPAHWTVSPTPNDGFGGAMITRSYDDDFFKANAIKGNWINGEPPEGAIKLDFVIFEGIVPEQSLNVAISEILGSDAEVSVVLSIEDTAFGGHSAALITTAPPHNPEDTFTSAAFRLSPDVILLVAAYPNNSLDSSDVHAILNSLVLDKSAPIVKPITAPHPPLNTDSDVSGQPTAANAVAWYGHIASLPEEDQYDDKVVLYPLGAGEVGLKGATAELEAEIVALRDAGGPNEFAHFWGTLYCNVSDYNACQLSVERIEYGDQYTGNYGSVDNWVGTIKSTTFNGTSSYVFELAGDTPMWYGIAASQDGALQSQIEALSDSGTLVKVWGDLLVGVSDVNGTRIEVRQLDPPGPGALPSSTTCESGYLGTVEEMLEVLQYNLELGNYSPFSYMIGNPFVIGYWRSEGVSLPREEAFAMLEAELLPSPEEVVIISDPTLFPTLNGIPLETMWGPDVDVAASLYSQGWGPDGQAEAILVIARCTDNEYDAYYWYGIVYAMKGFE